MFFIHGTENFVKIMADNSFVDQTTIKQLMEMVDHPSFTKPIVIMPDCHAGKGCVIGFTNKMGSSIIPNVVGVDIGCGMMTAKLKINRDKLDLGKLDEVVHKYIPSGSNDHNNFDVLDDNPEFDTSFCHDVAINIGKESKIQKFLTSIGTLGSGNHFISADIDDNDEQHVYLTVHTGSRNFGHSIAEFYQKMAVNLCNDMKINVPKGSEYLPVGSPYYSSLGERYLTHMRMAQQFAVYNRFAIIRRIIDKMVFDDDICVNIINCSHNYIDHDKIIRKGAISANLDEEVIIPLNMRDGILLGIGKGNSGWNYSAPHGAGRIMSRKEAKDKVSVHEYMESMKGVYSSSVGEKTIDESPMAYKDSNCIKEYIKDTVEITHHLKPIYNFKASK